MGKFILCSGAVAEKPYYFELTDTRIYSIEELCYYIYHNIYAITEEDFNQELICWLKEEVKMQETASKLEYIMEHKNKKESDQNYLKDIVVSLLCSGDYYEEEEILSLIGIMDSIYSLSPSKKRKMKGDNYLKYKNYAMAASVYDEILRGEEAKELTTEEYGDLLHNQAITAMHMTSYLDAIKGFEEAYSRNQKEDSLKAYLIALKIGKGEAEWEKGLQKYVVSEEKKQEYIKEIEQAKRKATFLSSYQGLQKLKLLKEKGKIMEYYVGIEEQMQKWKQSYRRESK